MPDTVAVQIPSSGTPAYEGSPEPPKWSSGTALLLSSLVGSVVSVTTPLPPYETVFLTRSQQRIMDRARRRSLRIIA